jgi:hypothetical protein
MEVTVIVNHIARFKLHTWIKDGNDPSLILGEFVCSSSDPLGKHLLACQEDPITVHVVEVKPERIARNLVFGKFFVKFKKIIVPTVSPTGLVISKGPCGGQWSDPNQLLKLSGEFSKAGSVQNPKVGLPTLAA